MLQSDLFGHKPSDSVPYAKGSETSKAAADRIAPFTEAQRARVYRHICACRTLGCTDQEAIAATGISGDSWRPRRGELSDPGHKCNSVLPAGNTLVVDSGTTRTTRSGAQAAVWVASMYYKGESK